MVEGDDRLPLEGAFALAPARPVEPDQRVEVVPEAVGVFAEAEAQLVLFFELAGVAAQLFPHVAALRGDELLPASTADLQLGAGLALQVPPAQCGAERADRQPLGEQHVPGPGRAVASPSRRAAAAASRSAGSQTGPSMSPGP